MSDDDPTAADILGECSNHNCNALWKAVCEHHRPVDSLDYEDVFYPLRHHHREGLQLAVSVADIDDRAYLRWGSGDFIYRRWQFETDESRIDPFAVWNGIQAGRLWVDVVVIDAETTDGAGGYTVSGP